MNFYQGPSMLFAYLDPTVSHFNLEVALATVASAIAVLLGLHFIFRPLFFSHLSHIPGPRISNVTGLWLAYHGYFDTANQYIHELHSQYGPVVRVAPNTISFNSVDTISIIYGVRSPFPKPATAANMDNYGRPNTFSSVSNADHRRRRNRYASSYAKSMVVQGEGYNAILSRVAKLLSYIKVVSEKSGDTGVDIYELFHFFSIDVACVFASGISLGLMDGRNLGFSRDLRDMFAGLAYVFYFFFIKTLIRWSGGFALLVLPNRVMTAMRAHDSVEDANMAHFLNSRDIKDPEFQKSVLSQLLNHNDYGSSDLTDIHCASEISDHLLAGADTLVAGVVYTFWELSRPLNRPALDRLITELQDIEFTHGGLPKSYASIDALVWLDCCLREGLRLHTPSGHIQSRVVSGGDAVLAGYPIPENTEVGVPLYSIQVNAKIFSDPYLFQPERWLESTNAPEKLQEMKRAWMTFGHGARICVGKELALVQIKLLLATVFHAYDAKLDDSQDQNEMEPIQAAVLAPKGGRCMLIFSELANGKIEGADTEKSF